MATPPKYPPQPQPIANKSDDFKVDRTWLAFFNSLAAQAAAAGSGTVTSVTATSPITSSGGATPNIALSNTAVTPATYGDSTHVSQITVDAKGRLTAASNVAIALTGGTVTTTGSPASGNLTKFSGATSITNGDLSGDVTTSGTLAATLTNTAVTPGTYGDSTHVAQVTIDSKGRATAAANVAIAATGTVTHTSGALTLNELVVGNGSADIKTVAATDGQIPIGKTSDGSVTLATLTAGANITITNSAASVTIAANAGSGSWIPLVNGAEPPAFITDGAGVLILVAYP